MLSLHLTDRCSRWVRLYTKMNKTPILIEYSCLISDVINVHLALNTAMKLSLIICATITLIVKL